MNYILKNEGIRVINKMLNKRIRDFYVYNRLIKKYLKIKTNIPIFINESIILLPIKSYKHYDCIWINYFEIKDIIDKNKNVIIRFKNGEVKVFDIGFNKLNRIIKNALIIKEYFMNFECESVIN